jgi:hypothetical protein
MKKYGLFGGNLPNPMQTFEGDEIKQDGQFVYVYEKEPGTSGGPGQRHQVAALKLGDGQLVKEIK